MLDVGDGHRLYVHDWGNAEATMPIVFLHGGPGTGCSDRHKQRFDPRINRVIFHDQRGSGRSTPYGELSGNDTYALADDIERIADKLQLDSFVLTGGSWGSCLALVYAIKHPERVSKLILSGVFTGSQAEINWMNRGLFKLYYPDVWQAFIAAVPADNRSDPTAYHISRLFADNTATAQASAHALSNLEGALLSLDDRRTPQPLTEDFDLVPTQLEAHYMRHGYFIPDNFIPDNAPNITTPTWLVQGRYDMLCPPITAFKLHRQIKHSRLLWTMAGHGNDRSTFDVLRTLYLQS